MIYLHVIDERATALLAVQGSNINVTPLTDGKKSGPAKLVKVYETGSAGINVGHLSAKWADGDAKRAALGLLKVNSAAPLAAYHHAGTVSYAPNIYGLTGNKIVEAVPFTLDELRIKKHTEVMQSYDEMMAASITGKYPQTEVDTWPLQRSEALAYDADNTAPVPFITDLAAQKPLDKNGEPDVAKEVARILPKVQTYIPAAAAILGKRQALDDQIDVQVDPGNPEATYDSIAAVTWA